MNMHKLSDAQEQTLINDSRVAAERYRENAKTLRDLNTGPATDQLAEQFERQAKESEHLARLIENGSLLVKDRDLRRSA